MTHSHSHAHSHADQSVSGRKLLWTILFNLGITAAEVIGGLLSGYLALLADAIHNLADVAALILAWLGVKASERPATKRSTYGYQRIEVMTAFISAVSLVVIAIFIIVEAYRRLLNPQPLTHPVLFLTVACIGLIGNIVSMWMLNTEKGKSLNMKTAFLHMTYDAASSVVVIVGGVIILFTGWVILDVILSVAIALAIVWSSYLVMEEAFQILMEGVPRSIDFDRVHDAIGRIDGVDDVHDLHIWSLSSVETALSCHINVDPAIYDRGPEIIDQINSTLLKNFNIGHGTIQLEVADCDRPDILCRQPENRRNQS